jgi:hypothetical protein
MLRKAIKKRSCENYLLTPSDRRACYSRGTSEERDQAHTPIKVGMRAKVIPEAPVGGEYIAEVKIVDRVIDAASGTFGVRLELPNSNHGLQAGLKCKVIFPGK